MTFRTEINPSSVKTPLHDTKQRINYCNIKIKKKKSKEKKKKIYQQTSKKGFWFLKNSKHFFWIISFKGNLLKKNSTLKPNGFTPNHQLSEKKFNSQKTEKGKLNFPFLQLKKVNINHHHYYVVSKVYFESCFTNFLPYPYQLASSALTQSSVGRSVGWPFIHTIHASVCLRCVWRLTFKVVSDFLNKITLLLVGHCMTISTSSQPKHPH